jgi:protocatechuate 3,4-dioxygenase beta subunit
MRPHRARFALIGIAALVAGSFVAPVVVLLAAPGGARGGQALQAACAPTAPDDEGPFYKPNAPQRASIGRGLVVSGAVRTAGDCAPIPKARLEWWQANPQGRYDDAHRAVQTADAEGRYRFETSFPVVYYGRPPHIHVKVLAPGHGPLTTQLYPKAGQTEIPFDFVLRPE